MRTTILMAAMLLAACGSAGDDGTQISIKGGDNGSDFTAGVGKDGAIAIDTPGFKGSIDLPKIRLDADNFDMNGVKLFPGSTIAGVNVDGGAGKDQVRVTFDSPAAVADVRDWFATRLKSAGFTLAAAGDSLSGTTDEGKAFKLALTPKGTDRSQGTITIGN